MQEAGHNFAHRSRKLTHMLMIQVASVFLVAVALALSLAHALEFHRCDSLAQLKRARAMPPPVRLDLSRHLGQISPSLVRSQGHDPVENRMIRKVEAGPSRLTDRNPFSSAAFWRSHDVASISRFHSNSESCIASRTRTNTQRDQEHRIRRYCQSRNSAARLLRR
jgi:hypothetical protein